MSWISFLALPTLLFAWAEWSPPPAPRFYVLDETQSLSARDVQTLESLVIEHDHLTGQQFMIALLKTCPENKDWSQKIFDSWKVGKRGQDNGVLLILCNDLQTGFIHTGTGVESVLDSNQTQDILETSVLPEMQERNAKQATLNGAYFILKALESPIFQSGKLDTVLHPAKTHTSSRLKFFLGSFWGSFLILILGGVFFGLTIWHLLAREAIFTSAGWSRTHPFSWLKKLKRKKKPDLADLGTSDGNW